MLGLGNGNGDGLTPSGGSLRKVVWYKTDFSSGTTEGWSSNVAESVSYGNFPETGEPSLTVIAAGAGQLFVTLDEDDFQEAFPSGDVTMGYSYKLYSTNELSSSTVATESSEGRDVAVEAQTPTIVSSAIADNSVTSLAINFYPASGNVGRAHVTDIEFYYYV